MIKRLLLLGTISAFHFLTSCSPESQIKGNYCEIHNLEMGEMHLPMETPEFLKSDASATPNATYFRQVKADSLEDLKDQEEALYYSCPHCEMIVQKVAPVEPGQFELAVPPLELEYCSVHGETLGLTFGRYYETDISSALSAMRPNIPNCSRLGMSETAFPSGYENWSWMSSCPTCWGLERATYAAFMPSY